MGLMCIFRHSTFQSTLPSRGATITDTGVAVTTMEFQSTLPSRGATTAGQIQVEPQTISIHAPLAGSDVQKPTEENYIHDNFNPRSPRGERPESLP